MNTTTADTIQFASLWQLAPDPAAYGDHAEWFILTTPDGDHEIGLGTFPDDDGATQAAQAAGYTVVPLYTDSMTAIDWRDAFNRYALLQFGLKPARFFQGQPVPVHASPFEAVERLAADKGWQRLSEARRAELARWRSRKPTVETELAKRLGRTPSHSELVQEARRILGFADPTPNPEREALGRAAYEADCAARPLYQDGGKRHAWEELPEYARESWRRNPQPRTYPKRFP